SDIERVIDLQAVLLFLRLGGVLVGDVGHIGRGLSPEVPLLDEGSLEVVEVDREGFEPVGVGPVPGVDRVVGRQSVGESVTLDEEHVAPVAEEGTGGQSQQESQERKVEKDVSGLTQVAALPGNG